MAPQDPSGGSVFAPVQRDVRLSDRVAQALIDAIVAGELKPGDRLPAERDLCEQFDVSRPVVREAVRSLIAKGLLQDSPRRGHTVRTLGIEALTESMTLYLHGQELDYGKLMEVRSVVEVEAAGLAAERLTPEQLAILTEAAVRLTQVGTAEERAVADTDFHRAIAAATDNAFFVMLIDSMRDVLLKVQLPTLSEPSIVQTASADHARILDAIAARDADAAREAMRAHLLQAATGLRAVLRSDPSSARVD